MAQFTRQSSRPLTKAGYAAAVRRMADLLITIRAFGAEPPQAMTPRERAKLTQAIHDLSRVAQVLSRRHSGLTHIEALRRTDGEIDGRAG